MKKKILIVLLFLVFACNNTFAEQKHVVLITASYNNKDWYQRNLDAAFAQNYDNYSLEYWNDCSSDGTGELVEKYMCARDYQLIEQQEDEKRVYKTYVRPEGVQGPKEVHLVHNKQRCGGMENQYYAIHRRDNTDVCIIYDGDDFFEIQNVTKQWIINSYVVGYINDVYQDQSVWMTYGQFIEWPSGRRGFCRQYPSHTVSSNAFRQYGHTPSHLRTFYAGLFKKIKKEDLKYRGEFLQMTGDIAAMFPMIEMARNNHFKFINLELLAYNAFNPLNNYKVSKRTERNLDLVIRARRRYEPITNPF